VNIRWKVTALIASLFGVLCITEIFVARQVLMPSFAELEHNDAEVAMRRIDYALDSTLDHLVLSVTGWANWTDAYRFMQDHNQRFIDNTLTLVDLKQLEANLLVYVDLQGRVSAGISADLQTGQRLDFEFLRGQQLAADFPWWPQLRDGRTARGLLITRQGVLLLAAAPVLDGFGSGPTLGMTFLGRLLRPEEIRRIGDQAQAQLAMLAPQSGTTAPRLIETDTLTEVYRTHEDIYGRPAMTLRVDVPRGITHRGELAVRYASLYLAAAAVIVLALLVWILNRVVLDPLARVTRHAVAIGEGRDLTTRLDAPGSDEIAVLAREFDRMVGRVAESRDRLVDQSFQAGFAELAKGVLHNLGNAMTPICVRLDGVRQLLRSPLIDDAELAIAELRRGVTDPARRADLEEFLLLVCEQFASNLRSMQGAVDVMSRQTAIVQTALTEQMQATRNEHVIESVRLNDLIAQTLEVVPDTARQRLRVETDASLIEIGPVRVARTVLRLVLQNFIINAADAVRETGREHGSLRIAADFSEDADGRHLHLVCTDDGIGIAPELLSRVFEKGYSTKSKETNYGIGLHWCANAISALGGRIWARSEGVGRGTSMHLLLPIDTHQAIAA